MSDHHQHLDRVVRPTLVANLARYVIMAAVAIAGVPASTTAQPISDAIASEATSVAHSQPSAESAYDRVWERAELYKNDDNDVLQSLVLSGRFQVDLAGVNADQGSHDEWNIRRFRFGAKARLFRHITLHSEGEFNPQERDPFYLRLTDTYVQWSRSPPLRITAGKHAAPFTMDGQTSSKELLTIDRNNLTNNLWYTQEYVPGVSVSGDHSGWSYHAGVYSGGRRDREFGDFAGSAFMLTSLGYDFGTRLGVKEATLTGNYVYQDPDPRNTFTNPFRHVASMNFSLDAGTWGLRTDVAGGDGTFAQGDLLAVMAMPYYNVTERAQFVARYTLVSSPHDNAVRLATYERSIVPGRGDRYNELFLGFNYFFYGHKLKLQAGLNLADMRDRANDGGAYSGVSGVLGLRTSW